MQTQGKLLVKDKSILHYYCSLYIHYIFYHYVRTIQTTFLKSYANPKFFFLHKLELYISYTSLSGQPYKNRAPSIDIHPASLQSTETKLFRVLHYFLQQTLAWKDIKHTNESDSVVEWIKNINSAFIIFIGTIFSL